MSSVTESAIPGPGGGGAKEAASLIRPFPGHLFDTETVHTRRQSTLAKQTKFAPKVR